MKDDIFNDARKWLHEGMDEAIAKAKKEKLRLEFDNLDIKSITKKSKKDLIAWLTGFPPDSPQYIFGQQELSRKSTSLKLKVAIWIAIFNAIIAISIALWKVQSQDLAGKPSTVQSEEQTTMSQLPVHNNKSMIYPYQPYEEKEGKPKSYQQQNK